MFILMDFEAFDGKFDILFMAIEDRGSDDD